MNAKMAATTAMKMQHVETPLDTLTAPATRVSAEMEKRVQVEFTFYSLTLFTLITV